MTLYIVATPIGNLSDITLRALETLKSVDLIITENFNDSRKLLEAYAIKGKKIEKYNDSNKSRTSGKIMELLKKQDAAYITSAGTPGISDPGSDLVRLCQENSISVFPIPGPTAFAAAFSVSGIQAKHFVFVGFLPRKKSKIKKIFETYLNEDSALLFYESPFRILHSLEILESFSLELEIFIAREMTKKFENYYHGKIGDILEMMRADKNMQKGEFSVIIKRP